MLKPKIHLCLVHNTATANVTPALDPDFRPDEVILLHGPKEDYHANCIEAVLKPVGIKVSRWKIQDTWTVEHICDRILELMAERENDDIALNASGGTRPMSIAAYEVFKEFNKPIFYANPETDYISWINRRDFPSFDIADRIKLPAFLHANGAQVSNQGKQSGVPSDLRHLTQELVKNSKILAKPLAAINWLAQQAELDLKSPILSVGQQNWYELQVLINQFAEAGLLESKQDRLYFKDEAARFFVNGGWLEVYTYGLLYGLRGEISKIQDVGRSIELNRD
ncbi:MAG: DUF1887 family protein, partial [Candidatus Marithrix sp.]|nr:DUF1887 family protein [Candidatus Marithrix sp.]